MCLLAYMLNRFCRELGTDHPILPKACEALTHDSYTNLFAERPNGKTPKKLNLQASGSLVRSEMSSAATPIPFTGVDC